MIQIFLADGTDGTDGTDGPTEGSTRGPRGPKKSYQFKDNEDDQQIKKTRDTMRNKYILTWAEHRLVMMVIQCSIDVIICLIIDSKFKEIDFTFWRFFHLLPKDLIVQL